MLARYLAALAYQQADRDAASTYGSALHCSPPKLAIPMPLVARETTLSAKHSPGILCSYPVFDPSSGDRLVPRDHHAVPLTDEVLAVINADLATATFSTSAPSECEPSRQELTLRLRTPGATSPAGGLVEFVGTCPDVLRLSGDALWWRPKPQTLVVLTALLPTD